MAFSRARYVTVCQQLLVAAVVSAVGVTAAGVMTLDIVSPEAAGQDTSAADVAPTMKADRGFVDTGPVEPTVRQVLVRPARTHVPGVDHGSARTESAPRVARIDGMRLALTTPAEKVTGYATIGVTWAPGQQISEDAIALQVRTSTHGTWSHWQELAYHDDHGPDGSEDVSDTARARPGTDAVVVGHVDEVQVRVATATGAAPTGTKLALIDPGVDHLTREAPAIDTARLDGSATAPAPDSSEGSGSIALSAMKTAPKPLIYSRAQWGANEKLREQTKPSYGTVETGFIHHTVNANDYSAADVPALIRGIYAYHVVSRGWRDIGYNYLVDRFGRIWEGRYGGVDKAVVGAHTKGYNEVSFAMSAIGNFDIAQPPQAVLDAFAKLFAWKLSLYNIRADATGLKVKSKVLHAINGHRDVGQTACPGRYLYAKLPEIRAAAQRIQNAAQGYVPTQPPAAAVTQPSGMTFPSATNLVGSGYPDVVLQKSSGAISVLPLGGMTGYRAPVTSSSRWSAGTWTTAVGDLSGDGRGEVMARWPHTPGWRLYTTNRAGQVVGPAMDGIMRLRGMNRLIAAGDWDRDGHADVLAVGSDHALYLYRGAWKGKGKGSFLHRIRLAKNWSRFTTTVVAGDLNSDHRPDLVALDSAHHLYQILSASTTQLHPASRIGTLTTYDALLGGGDLTGDGIGDVLVRQRSTGDAYIIPGTGHGTLGRWLGPFPGLRGLSQLSAGQLRGGRRPDVLGRGADGRLRVVANNDRVNVGRIVSSGLTTTSNTALLNVGDWDGDSRPDLVNRVNGGDKLVLLRGLGGGRFGTGITMSSGWRTITQLAAVGDITGDRRPDLVGRTPDGVMEVFAGNGKHGFVAPRRLAASVRTYNQVGGSAWDTTRVPGTLLPSSDGTFVPFAGGTDAATAMRRVNQSLGTYDWLIGSGDVNGDGHADLLGRQRSDGALWLIPGTATGFGSRQFVTGGLGKYRLGG